MFLWRPAILTTGDTSAQEDLTSSQEDYSSDQEDVVGSSSFHESLKKT